MLHTRHLDYDPEADMVETFHFDPYEDKLIIESTQRVDQILEVNNYMQNETQDWQGEWHRVASIPVSMLADLQQKGIMDFGGRILDQKALKRWLNDSDNRKLRAKLGGL